MGSRAESLAVERARLQSTAAPAATSWEQLCPGEVLGDEVLQALAAHLRDPATVDALCEGEAAGRYPRQVLEELQARGLTRLLSEAEGEPSRVTAQHLACLNALTARVDTSLAVTVGVQALSLLPVYLGADAEQLARVFGRVRGGALCSMLLSELDHGSNLLRNQTRAEPQPDGSYLLRGEKELINGGREHDLMISLLRTRDPAPDGGPLQALADMSVFVVERQAGVRGLERWSTLPAQAADISGVAFEGVRVAAADRLGREGEGFALIKRALTVSRGGIAALASGTLGLATDLARCYADKRDVYGAPIAGLGAIAGHLRRLEALDTIVACVALKAAWAINALGQAGAYFTALAKFAACELAEEGVREGARVLGARALVRELPYERVSRDVLLYGVFDGTRHVMLEELSGRLIAEARRFQRGDRAGEDTLAALRQLYAAPPRPLREVARRRASPFQPPLLEHARALAALPGAPLEDLPLLAEGLLALVAQLEASRAWDGCQELRFQATEALALLEALVATVELSDGERRVALGMSPLAPRQAVLGRLASGWLGARVATAIQRAAGGLAPEAWQPQALREHGGLEGACARLLAIKDEAARDLT
ncbi:MAG: acyl-CoA dehydrogenase family protein [Planctomycetota bacterium]